MMEASQGVRRVRFQQEAETLGVPTDQILRVDHGVLVIYAPEIPPEGEKPRINLAVLRPDQDGVLHRVIEQEIPEAIRALTDAINDRD